MPKLFGVRLSEACGIEFFGWSLWRSMCRVPRTGSTCEVDGKSWVKGGISDNFAVLTSMTRPMQQPVSLRLRKGVPKSLPQINTKHCISAVASATQKVRKRITE